MPYERGNIPPRPRTGLLRHHRTRGRLLSALLLLFDALRTKMAKPLHLDDFTLRRRWDGGAVLPPLDVAGVRAEEDCFLCLYGELRVNPDCAYLVPASFGCRGTVCKGVDADDDPLRHWRFHLRLSRTGDLLSRKIRLFLFQPSIMACMRTWCGPDTLF